MCVKARGVGAEPGGRWVQLSCSRWAIYRDNLCTPVEKRQICALKMATSGADWRISYAACVCLCVHIARNRMLWRFVKVCELGKNNKLLHTHNNQSCMPHTHTHIYANIRHLTSIEFGRHVGARWRWQTQKRLCCGERGRWVYAEFGA